MVGDAAERVGEPGLRVMSLSLAVAISVYIAAARSPPRSEPRRNRQCNRLHAQALAGLHPLPRTTAASAGPTTPPSAHRRVPNPCRAAAARALSVPCDTDQVV
jgi:hypothetical protein